KVDFILNEFYKNTPDGLIGNEDCGQMSAWYVLSSLGLYAVTPGNPEWTTIKPFFKNFRINLEDGTVMNSSVLNDMKYLGISRSKPPTEDDMPMIIPVPVIISDSKAFADRLTVRIENGAVDKKYRNPMLYCKIGDS